MGLGLGMLQALSCSFMEERTLLWAQDPHLIHAIRETGGMGKLAKMVGLGVGDRLAEWDFGWWSGRWFDK